MKFKAEIDVMPHAALLDPQGKAVTGSMKNIGLSQINQVRIGKHMSMELEAANQAEAEQMVDEACKKLLANLIMESYQFQVSAM
jgi:phosphoribosylformylglycinamidine synthase PurS subunit